MDHRFKYHQTGEEEELVTNYQRYTVDKGLQTAQAATFVVEGREDAFIDPTQCWESMLADFGYRWADLRAFMLHGIDGAWVDDETKQAWARAWTVEFDGLNREAARD